MLVTAQGWWLQDAGAVDPQPPLAGEHRADVVVVGGGYTGMWAAWHLRERGADVVLLDAGICGEGPSGRNGGFVDHLAHAAPRLRALAGDEAARATVHASLAAVAAIGTWCAEHAPSADFRRGGQIVAAAAPAQDGTEDGAVAACAALGLAGELLPLSPAEVRSRCASPVLRGGVLAPSTATVHPGHLARALRAALLERGVRVFERARVTGLAGATVRTAHGRVVAGSALLGLNAWSAAVPPLRRRLTVTSSHMVITEPVPDVLEEIGWTGGECITDSRHMIHYFRTTPDGRIAFGWGGGRVVRGARLNGHAEVDRVLAAEVERHLRRFFPQLEGRSVSHAWGGPIDVSPTHLPVIRSTGERTFAGFGYTGNGVGPSQMVGRALASMALGRRDEHTELAIVDPPPVLVPPEPFRYAGGAVIRRALLRKEAAEEEGRRVDPLTRFVSGIPERLGIHVGR